MHSPRTEISSFVTHFFSPRLRSYTTRNIPEKTFRNIPFVRVKNVALPRYLNIDIPDEKHDEYADTAAIGHTRDPLPEGHLTTASEDTKRRFVH